MDREYTTGAAVASERAASPQLLIEDRFEDQRSAGNVIGSNAGGSVRRLGVDVEGAISIDNSALRIAPLIEAGFGRAVLAYGPFQRRPGLAFAVFMANGHNTAQDEPLSDGFRQRIDVWLRGSMIDPVWRRVAVWLRAARFRRTFRQILWWRRTANSPVAPLDENLAVGWFPEPVVADPRREGSAFIMHALGPWNGALWAGGPDTRTKSLHDVQNVPIYYIGVVCGEGVVYYAGSVDGAPGLPAYPLLRPIALERGTLPDKLFVGIQQSVLGQVGFRLDTRVHGVRVAELAGYESWCGGAHAAAARIVQQELVGTSAEVGGDWEIWSDGADSVTGNLAVVDPGAPSGLICAVATAVESKARTGLVWRCQDTQNHWRLELGARACDVVLVLAGQREVLLSHEHEITAGTPVRLQILEDGVRFMVYLDGEPLSQQWLADTRLSGASKVGMLLEAGGLMRAFEAHPRQIKLPAVLDLGAPWLRKGTRVVLEENFIGPAGDLAGRSIASGNRWERLLGSGVIELTGASSARVRASASEPCPGRTMYCVDWPHADFVDMEVIITPPGTGRGEKHRTTAGLVLYQDNGSYVMLNLWRSDFYAGGSVSTFFRFGDYEDVYDAIWTNIGDRVDYGRPLRLRLCSDGEYYAAMVNDETVLVRAFRDVYPDVGRLHLRKVGIIANWEFGTDTGSRFEQLKLRV